MHSRRKSNIASVLHNSVISPSAILLPYPRPLFLVGWKMTRNGRTKWVDSLFCAAHKVSKDTSVCFIYFPVADFPARLVAFTPSPVLFQLWSKAISVLKGRGRETSCRR